MSDRRLLLILIVVIAIALILINGPSTIGGQTIARHRTTYYTQQGVTASGAYVDVGVVSCSYRWPLGAHVTIWSDDFSQEYHGVCLDRGLLDAYGVSLDVWLPDDAAGRWFVTVFGEWPYAVVEVEE